MSAHAVLAADVGSLRTGNFGGRGSCRRQLAPRGLRALILRPWRQRSVPPWRRAPDRTPPFGPPRVLGIGSSPLV